MRRMVVCPDSGWAVLIDPIKPTLKARGTERLKVKYDKLLSIFCLQFQLAPLHSGLCDLASCNHRGVQPVK